MSNNPTPDSTGGFESSQPPERALARAIVADAVDRNLEAMRAHGRWSTTTYRRLLERLVAVLGRNLRGDGPGRFAVRDHWLVRLLDAVDLLRTAWSKLH